MDTKLQELYQDQIGHEYAAAYLYLSMASWFESAGFEGFAHWMNEQASEEQEHAAKLSSFLQDRGIRVILRAIPQPDAEFASPLEVFEKTLAHEQKVTSLINAIADWSEKVNDHASKVFIQWFITEQIEEEKSPSRIVDLLKKVKPDSAAVYQLDHRLGKRE